MQRGPFKAKPAVPEVMRQLVREHRHRKGSRSPPEPAQRMNRFCPGPPGHNRRWLGRGLRLKNIIDAHGLLADFGNLMRIDSSFARPAAMSSFVRPRTKPVAILPRSRSRERK